MLDKTISIVTFFVYACRDAAVFSYFLRRMHVGKVHLLFFLNVLSYVLFLFGYCFYYMDYVKKNIFKRLLAPEKDEMAWFFISTVWANVIQQIGVFYILMKYYYREARQCTLAFVCTGLACVSSVVLCLFNPAALYLDTGTQVWAVSYACVQATLVVMQIYMAWGLSS